MSALASRSAWSITSISATTVSSGCASCTLRAHSSISPALDTARTTVGVVPSV
eukprot:CAMPEP_0205913650 /NCGR_PEP_ID=MMETSP1325-20131115/6687_1 /ASSEMBLY_ACC=CAM_ASM_000708 /TAXON_ID=236786 /ORGANISM="Florenciella sp., Strain RCC1007" /LENGTH=52 /DNA_ID=CAMNT_0053280559 /DNA_START=36 /DNA_END=194 /DNA_ORIENTATION=+